MPIRVSIFIVGGEQECLLCNAEWPQVPREGDIILVADARWSVYRVIWNVPADNVRPDVVLKVTSA